MIESASERPAFLLSGCSVHINDVTSLTVWSEQLQLGVITHLFRKRSTQTCLVILQAKFSQLLQVYSK